MHSSVQQRGFTLLELVVVIAILAVLAFAVVAVINPAELLRRSRDSQRLSDLNALNKSINLTAQEQSLTSGTWDPDGPNFTDACTGEANPKVFVSVPSDNGEASPTDLPTGWTYARVTKANAGFINGTGWMPVNLGTATSGSPISNLPLDPTNTFASGHYYTYVCQRNPHFKITTLLESQTHTKTAATDGGTSSAAYELGTNITLAAGIFPGGWTRSPGGTLVMQYEAKYDKNGDGTGDTAAAAGCAADSGLGLDWRDTGCSTAANIVSTAEGAPIVHITHDQAKAACAAVNAHVIRNDEWMALVRNAEQVAANWSSGTVGTGCLFRGNNGTADACGYNASNDPEYGSARNTKAQLLLSNGAEVWDLAGNVWEHVLRDASDTLLTDAEHPDTASGAGAFAWREFTDLTGYGALSYDAVRPSNTSWNATHGMGRIYTCDQCGGAAARVLLRGGYWGSGAYAGAFTMLLGWVPSTQGTDVGFRCAR